MFRQRLDFTPDESALKYQRERDEYIKRLKNFQSVSALAPVQPEPSVSEAVAEVESGKKQGFFGTDAALIGGQTDLFCKPFASSKDSCRENLQIIIRPVIVGVDVLTQTDLGGNHPVDETDIPVFQCGKIVR